MIGHRLEDSIFIGDPIITYHRYYIHRSKVIQRWVFDCPACEYRRPFNTKRQAVGIRSTHIAQVHPRLRARLMEADLNGL